MSSSSSVPCFKRSAARAGLACESESVAGGIRNKKQKAKTPERTVLGLVLVDLAVANNQEAVPDVLVDIIAEYCAMSLAQQVKSLAVHFPEANVREAHIELKKRLQVYSDARLIRRIKSQVEATGKCIDPNCFKIPGLDVLQLELGVDEAYDDSCLFRDIQHPRDQREWVRALNYPCHKDKVIRDWVESDEGRRFPVFLYFRKDPPPVPLPTRGTSVTTIVESVHGGDVEIWSCDVDGHMLCNGSVLHDDVLLALWRKKTRFVVPPDTPNFVDNGDGDEDGDEEDDAEEDEDLDFTL